MDIVKGAIEDARVTVDEAGGAVLTVATAVYQVFDLAGASVQAQDDATITDNGTALVVLSGLITTTAAGFVIDSDYEILFTYTIGAQTKLKRIFLHIGEETGAAIAGNYISEGDVGNWPAGITDEDKLDAIERSEAEVERVTKDVFYEAPFDVFKDGPGADFIELYFRGRIQSVSAIYIEGIVMNAVNYSHNAHVVHRSNVGIESDDYLRYLRNRRRRYGDAALFPEGMGNLEIVGTIGWPEKLDYDNLSGTFRVGEVITGATNSYTAWVKKVTSSALWIAGKSGQYVDDEEVEGGTSEATADVDSASGAVTDPPNGIKQAAKMLARFDNDSTLFTRYEEGSESIAGVSVSNPRRPLTGIREIDRILSRFVRKVPRMAVI